MADKVLLVENAPKVADRLAELRFGKDQQTKKDGASESGDDIDLGRTFLTKPYFSEKPQIVNGEAGQERSGRDSGLAGERREQIGRMIAESERILAEIGISAGGRSGEAVSAAMRAQSETTRAVGLGNENGQKPERAGADGLDKAENDIGMALAWRCFKADWATFRPICQDYLRNQFSGAGGRGQAEAQTAEFRRGHAAEAISSALGGVQDAKLQLGAVIDALKLSEDRDSMALRGNLALIMNALEHAEAHVNTLAAKNQPNGRDESSSPEGRAV